MNIKTIYFFAVICFLLASCSKTENEVLNKTLSELEAIETLEYQIAINQIHEVQEEFAISALCYFDFRENDSLIGAQCEISYDEITEVYNGYQSFTIDENAQKIIYNNTPQIGNAVNWLFMGKSVWAIRKLLPELMQDSTVCIRQLNDTVAYGVENYKFDIVLKNKFIARGGVLKETEFGPIQLYLLIAKETYLPTELKRIFQGNKGFVSFTYSNYNFSKIKPDSIWDIDSYPHEYLRVSVKEQRETGKKAEKESIEKLIGKEASDWKLPLLNSTDSIQLSEQRGSLVLLEFWGSGCGGCISAIPEINGIHKTYINKGLEVYGIEFWQKNDKGLCDFVEEENIEYPILHTGKSVAHNYGIYVAPTIYLLDGNGKILYVSMGLEKEELIKSIDQNL